MQELIVEILTSPSNDARINTAIGKLLIQQSLFNLWLSGEGRDRLQSDEFIAYAEQFDAKLVDIRQAWSEVLRRSEEFKGELSQELYEGNLSRRESHRVRKGLDESTGYADSRGRLAGRIEELIGLTAFVAPMNRWMPECVLCGTDLHSHRGSPNA